MNLSRFSSGSTTAISIAVGLLLGPNQGIAQRALGTDVSSYQGSAHNPPTTINWPVVASDGVTFAWAKATEGVSITDADFTYNASHAKSAGIPIGGYDFAHPEDNTPAAEAGHFWSVAGPYVQADGLTIMPMLDYETFTGTIVGASSYSAWANLWCSNIVADAASNGIYVKPVIYVGPCNDDSYLNSSVSGWLNNIAVYPTSPNAQTGNPWTSSTCTTDPGWGKAWNVWQYYDTNWSGGDSDVFNGNVTQMIAALVATSTAPQAPAGATVFWDPGNSFTSPGAGGSGTWDTSTTTWWYTGSSNVAWSASGDNAIFAGTPGTVTMDANLSAGSLTFETNSYNIAGTSSTLTLTNPALITIPPPGSGPVTMSCILSASSGYSVTGGGVFVLANTANSSSGPVNIGSNTTLVIDSSACIGLSSGTVNITNGGILQNNDELTRDVFLNSGVNIVLGAGTDYLNVNTAGGLSYGGVISGTGNLTKSGAGATLTLNGTNTYFGNTTVSQGTLALGATGSINNSGDIIIDAGGTLDVSAISGWTLNSGAILTASGTGTAAGSTAATIKGSSTNSPNFGSQPITLVYTPTATNGDSSHPALYISAGTLVLTHANTFTISNGLGTALGTGQYTLIEQASGSISGTPYPTPAFEGKGVATGNKASLSVSNGIMYLIVAATTTTTLSPLTASTYGQSVMFTATVSPAPSGGTVQFYTNGVTIGSPVAVSGGTASYTASGLPVGSYAISASYGGVTLYLASSLSTSTQQVNPLPVVLTGTEPYNGTTAAPSSILSVSNVQGSDTVGVASGNGVLSSASVGTNAISSFGNLALGGAQAAEYTLNGASGTVIVTPVPLDIAATPQSKMYGTVLTFGPGSTNFSGTGLQNGDTVGSVTLAVSGNGGASNAAVGSYIITPSAATGGTFSPNNYSIVYITNTLTVTLPSNTIPVTITSITLLTNGTVAMSFAGTPGYVYYIEAATNLNPPIAWSVISTNAADTNGNFCFTDLCATNYNGRYYQTQAEPAP